MKKTIIGLLLLLAKTSYGQYTLEYEYNTYIESVVLENSGLKYYTLIPHDQELIIYNTDHTVWKTIYLPIDPLSSEDIYINHISETKINPDNKVEIIYTQRKDNGSGVPIDDIKIINEEEQLLWSSNVELLNNITVIENNTGNKILISSNSSDNVYSLPDFSLEHEYSVHAIRSIILENSGQKYYSSDTPNAQVKVYNSDHTIWKTINLPIPSHMTLQGVVHLSESKINPDSHLEMGYIVHNSQQSRYELKIANELGTILLDLPAAYTMSDIEEGATKLILTPLILMSPPFKSIVYSLPELTLEHEYSHEYSYSSVIKKKLANSGEKYYAAENNQINIYNSDHTLWKTINATLPSASEIFFTDITHISEKVLNNNSQVELIVNYFDESFESKSMIIDENGTVLLTTEGELQVIISPQAEGTNKLLASSYEESTVYSISETTTSIEAINTIISAKIVPNPTSDIIKISVDTLVHFNQIAVYDQEGKNVLVFEHYNHSPIDVSFLPKGLYFLIGKRSDKILFKSKFIIH